MLNMIYLLLIGLLFYVDIFLYFDEKDELNFKQSSLLQEVSKPFTVDSFKSLYYFKLLYIFIYFIKIVLILFLFYLFLLYQM